MRALQAGRLRLSLAWLSTLTHTEHDVDDDQLEPGIAPADQARVHTLDFVLMDWNASAALALSDWLEVELMVPVRMIGIEAGFRDAGGNALASFDSIHHRDETLFGLGDLSVTGRARALDGVAGDRWTIDLRAGASLPTGGTKPNPFERARRGLEHQHMFFGTGTVDPLVGLSVAYRFDPLTLSSWGLARRSLYANDYGYRGPGTVSGGLVVDAGLGLSQWRFQLGGEVFHESPAEWSGEPAENSGRTDLVAVAGARFIPSAAWDLTLTGKIPFTLEAEGGQLNTPFVLIAGASTRLDLW